MGGDYAPDAVIEGAVDALSQLRPVTGWFLLAIIVS